MIKLIDINKEYVQKGSKVLAVKNANLEVQKGEIYGIIGYSGAGKSSNQSRLLLYPHFSRRSETNFPNDFPHVSDSGNSKIIRYETTHPSLAGTYERL